MQTQSPTPTAPAPAPASNGTATPTANPSLDVVFKFDDLNNMEPDPVEPAEPQDSPADDVPADEPQDDTPVNDQPPADDADVPPQDDAPPAEPEVDEDIKPFLKKMSKEASAAVLKKIQAQKAEAEKTAAELAAANEQIAQFQGKKLPDNWYNDPEAYRAVPQYREAEAEFNKAAQETSAWADRLAAYEAGEIVYDQKSDTFVPHTGEGPAVPNPRIKRALEDRRLEAYEKQKDFAAKANEIQKTFSEVYKQAEQHVTSNTERIFPFVKDEKHASHAHYKKILEQFPKQFHGHPVTKLAGALGLRVIQLQVENKELKAKKAAQNGVKLDQKKAGPIPGRNARPASNNVMDREWTDKDLQDL